MGIVDVTRIKIKLIFVCLLNMARISCLQCPDSSAGIINGGVIEVLHSRCGAQYACLRCVSIQSHRYWVFIMTTLVHFPNVCNQYFQDGPLYKEQLYEKLSVRHPQTKPARTDYQNVSRLPNSQRARFACTFYITHHT